MLSEPNFNIFLRSTFTFYSFYSTYSSLFLPKTDSAVPLRSITTLLKVSLSLYQSAEELVQIEI